MHVSIFIILLSLYFFVLPIVLIYNVYKFWKQKNKPLSLFFALVLFFLYAPIVCDLGCQMCGLEEEHARSRVIKHLKSKNMDINNIEYTGHSGSCSYSYTYHDNNNTIDYVILDTWLHGVKLNYYDYNRDNPTPQTYKSAQETKQ